MRLVWVINVFDFNDGSSQESDANHYRIDDIFGCKECAQIAAKELNGFVSEMKVYDSVAEWNHSRHPHE